MYYLQHIESNIMTRRPIYLGVALALSTSIISASVFAGGVTYKDGDKYLKIGGRIQLQYRYEDPNNGSSTDDLFFRRLRPYIEGSVHKDWKGKFQFDYGKVEDDNEVAVKDAYLQYKGFDKIKVTAGNYGFPFSREYLTSSKYQQLVERTFVGDHNYGTPDRQMGVFINGKNADKKVTYGLAVAMGAIDPDDDKIDMDSLANKKSDFNEGIMFGGRVDFHPFGYLKKKQGDFKREKKLTIGVGAYSWNNDDDNNTRTVGGMATDPTKPDVDSVTGWEISSGFRNAGFSVDAQYNSFDAETVDPTVTSGVYRNGETTLTNWSVEGGYMIVPSKWEMVLGYQEQDADGYQDVWTRTSVGLNWFIKKQDIKVQLSYRMGENLKGQNSKDRDEIFLQTQYVF
ncbi:MAG TPA: hypothetical protein ENI64_03360 [Gammaproteobacteria bacterium]|nr:hypothetical protein [Gammaproteobacteria bacterium]